MIFRKLLNNKVKEIAEQRKVLAETFPYTDWKKIPYTQYDKFLSLKDLIGECGVVWTNAFGRSNTEAEETRKYLKDYSGNERDIELFNFGYSKQSGYNGYVQDFRTWSDTDDSATINRNESTIEISNNTAGWVVALWNVSTYNTYINKQWTIDLHIISSTSSYISLLFFDNNSSQYKAIQLNEGRNVIQPLTEEEYAKTNFIRINCNAESHVVITQIPEYLGALVSDGIDDYGQCVKDFALPDDYTVVAMRELLNTGPSGIINKTRATGEGAFIFEYGGSQSYSYGDNYSGLTPPKLFSYQTKASYNGTVLTPGTGADTADDKLLIFRLRDGTSNYISAALYSFGIFNRTLTAEELALVEDCMYLELEYNTNILDGIEYYDILDARFRSNDEDADKRNRWVGRLGKLHMTLNGYAYSGMSGWNGMSGDFSKFTKNSDGTLVSKSQSKVTLKWGSDVWVGMIPYSSFPQGKYAVRVSFSNPNMQSSLFIYYNTETSSSVTNVYLTSGINIVDKTLSSQPNYVFVSSSEAKPGDEITLELIPLYGGALVSDGVDDNAVSAEMIDEPIGGIVVQAEKISDPSGPYGNIFSSSVGLDGSSGKEIAGLVSKGSDSIIMGDPWTTLKKDAENIYGLSRVPISPGNKLMIGNNNSNEWGNAALYQLRLIKSQPTDLQLEVIKHQVLIEHNDYVKEMG